MGLNRTSTAVATYVGVHIGRRGSAGAHVDRTVHMWLDVQNSTPPTEAVPGQNPESFNHSTTEFIPTVCTPRWGCICGCCIGEVAWDSCEETRSFNTSLSGLRWSEMRVARFHTWACLTPYTSMLGDICLWVGVPRAKRKASRASARCLTRGVPQRGSWRRPHQTLSRSRSIYYLCQSIHHL